MAHPTVEAIPLIAAQIPYIGGILSSVINAARYIWFIVYSWNFIGVALGICFFSFFFELWILDAWGWLEMDWFWQIFAPLDDNGNYGVVDDWVAVNTWTMAYTTKVIERESGKSWDASDEQHLQMMEDYTWAYIFEQMNALNAVSIISWYPNTFWMIFCPNMYVDDQGNALDGYPLMMAKSYEMSKMYIGDYSWLNDPRSRTLKFEWNYPFVTACNVFYG